MGIPKDYAVQDGCWNCKHSLVIYGSCRCTVEMTAPCVSPGYVKQWHKWLEEHFVQDAGKCGRHVVDDWLVTK
jgi:hypothetical protein